MSYRAPVAEIAFALKHGAGMREAMAAGLYGDLSADDVDAVLSEAGRFASDVSFESSRFEGDASFLGLVAPGRAHWRNVGFARDAEFRACRLGEADFGDELQMTVFAGLADFRGCHFRSLRLDYVEVNRRVAKSLRR